MEIGVLGSSQLDIGSTGLGYGGPRLSNPMTSKFLSTRNRICFGRGKKWRSTAGIRFVLNAAVRPEAALSDKSLGSKFKPSHGVRLYVGLPMDSVSDCYAANRARAMAAGLKALKLLGVDGVELPVWWGVAEKEAMGKYQWSAYLALAEMVQKVGLKLHVCLCFHASRQPEIPLPQWVSRIGEADPSIFFADRSGQSYKGCLSLAVDNLPVLNGKTPVQVYQDFCEEFKSTFSAFMGSTITDISMGLGPEGELRYPSSRGREGSRRLPGGVGEFQCYDKNMLRLLKQCAEAGGTPLWGLGGPHDAPSYDQLPSLNGFFKEQGGSWETPYGNFFLSWYSGELIAHADRLLAIASTTLTDSGVKISGKVPLVHSWYNTRSHPSELTAGFYNTAVRDGYEAVAELFSRYSCRMILPGMDLADAQTPRGSKSSPELLLGQIKRACRKHGVEVSGQNSSVSGSPQGFQQIMKNLAGEEVVVDLFTYQRMSASFFSPKHFPLFTELVRGLNQPEPLSDDLPGDREEAAESFCFNAESGEKVGLQAA